MSDRRERLLEAMGLGPLWRLRELGHAARDASVAPPREASVEQALESSVGPPLDTSVASILDAKDAPPAGAIETSEHFESSEHVEQSREQRILHMDWQALKEAVAGCVACKLCETRKQTVFGVGDERAQWMIVGEAPGAEEDARGEPFVGQAGRLLDSMLASLEMQRSANVYIANVLKCRPPGNRNPEPIEVAECSPHLRRQIALVQPKLILAMGRAAAQTLLNSTASIASMRGRLFKFEEVPVIVTYHPAYLLRSLADKSKAWEDLLFARRTMTELIKQALHSNRFASS